jgi:hypothetical protein
MKPTKVEATWSGERPIIPQESSAQRSIARRRATSSAWLRGIIQARLTRRPGAVGDSKVISSGWSAWWP